MKAKLFLFVVLLLLDSVVGKPGSDMILVQGTSEVESFYISSFELTLGEFHRFVEATSYKTEVELKGEGRVIKGRFEKVPGVNWRHDIYGELIDKADYNRFPVTRVSANDAMAYCKWAGLEIPSIEQWFYAANEGSFKLKYKYSGSNSINQVAWFETNSGEQAQEVGKKKANALGLHDMTGNVAELVWSLEQGDTIYQYVGGSFFHGRADAHLKPVLDKEGIRLVKDEYTRRWTSPFLGIRLVKRVEE